MKKTIVIMNTDKFNSELEMARNKATISANKANKYANRKREVGYKASIAALGAGFIMTSISSIGNKMKVNSLTKELANTQAKLERSEAENAALKEVIKAYGSKY